MALCVEYRIKQSKASNFRRRNYRVFLISYKPLNWRRVPSGRIVVTDKGRLLIAAAAEIPGKAFIQVTWRFRIQFRLQRKLNACGKRMLVWLATPNGNMGTADLTPTGEQFH